MANDAVAFLTSPAVYTVPGDSDAAGAAENAIKLAGYSEEQEAEVGALQEAKLGDAVLKYVNQIREGTFISRYVMKPDQIDSELLGGRDWLNSALEEKLVTEDEHKTLLMKLRVDAQRCRETFAYNWFVFSSFGRCK